MQVSLWYFTPDQIALDTNTDITPTSPHPADEQGAMGSMMQDLAFAIPGVDEAMGFAEIMKYVGLFICVQAVPFFLLQQRRPAAFTACLDISCRPGRFPAKS